MLKIRRYFGYDCNSIEGFNNGYYVDDTFIEVKDHDHAFKACEDFLRERYNIPAFTTDLQDLDNGVELVTGTLDDDEYTYVFVNYEVID